MKISQTHEFLITLRLPNRAVQDRPASITWFFLPLTSAFRSDRITPGLLRHGNSSETTNHDKQLPAASAQMMYYWERPWLTRWRTLERCSSHARPHPKWHAVKYWRGPGCWDRPSVSAAMRLWQRLSNPIISASQPIKVQISQNCNSERRRQIGNSQRIMTKIQTELFLCAH